MNVRTLREAGHVLLLPPVRLEEDAVDLFRVDDANAVTDGLEEPTDAQVPRVPKDAFARADERTMRSSASGVKSAAKLPLLDMAHEALAVRGLSFIAVGGVLLLGAYAYRRAARRDDAARTQ